MNINQELTELAGVLKAFGGDSRKIKRFISRSKMIGKDGHLIRIHNDPTASKDARDDAGTLAGTLGALWAGKITGTVAGCRIESVLLRGNLASAIKAYPCPKLLPRDTFIYDNIMTMPFKELILAVEKRKKTEGWKPIASMPGFRDAALRYSKHHNLSTRNFREEKPIKPTETD